MNFDFKKQGVHVLALILFLGTAVVYFIPQFQGKKINQGDIIQYRGMSQELKNHKEQYGETTLWTNAMFGGMPTYQINTIQEGNQLRYLKTVFSLGIPSPTGTFLIAMIAFYILMIAIGVNPWLSIIGAIAFGFTTNNVILYEAGHVTKLRTIAFFPLVALGLFQAFRGRYLLGGLVFALGLGLDLMSNHVQMTYYLFLTFPVWAIAEFIIAQRKGELPGFFKAVGALTIGGLLAIGSVAANYWSTYEYSKDTMRGKPILESSEAPNNSNSSEVDGLAWDYAMQWSAGTIDLAAAFIPGVAGGSSAEPTSRNSAFGQEMTRTGFRLPEEFDAPLYWGALPFTSGPSYFGALIFLFFAIGLILVKGPVKWWLGLGVLLTFILAMGKNMEFINRLLFDYFPLFNKFRTPNSVLSITAFLVPVLAALGLQKIVSGEASKEEVLRSIKIGGGVLAAVALFYAFLGASFYDFSTPSDAARLNQMLGGQGNQQMVAALQGALVETRQDLMRADAIRSLIFVALSAGLVYFFVQGKIKQAVLLGGLGLLTLIDIMGVNLRYLNSDDFVAARNYDQNFAARPVDTQILQDTDLSFRVMDLTAGNPFESSSASYYHKSIGGYHAAKLQRYQDMISRYLSQGNQAVIDMMNTKYFITPGQDGQAVAQQNPGAMGNAWFVDTIRIVNTNNAEIDAVGQINLRTTAAVHQEFSDYLQGLDPDGQGTISLTDYRANRLTYQTNTASEQLAVFSEVWYGPDKGWKVTIDGKPADHIRANYILRAMKVPAGQHEIVFEFSPSRYYTGVWISRISSLLIILGLLGLAYLWYRDQPKTVAADPAPTAKPAPPKKKTVKKKRKKK